MSLQDELHALRAEFLRTAPPGRAAVYDAKVEELKGTFRSKKHSRPAITRRPSRCQARPGGPSRLVPCCVVVRQ